MAQSRRQFLTERSTCWRRSVWHGTAERVVAKTVNEYQWGCVTAWYDESGMHRLAPPVWILIRSGEQGAGRRLRFRRLITSRQGEEFP